MKPSRLAASEDYDILFLSGVRCVRSVGPRPVVAEVGLTNAFYLNPFGSGSAPTEVHVAAGGGASLVPMWVSAVAGPSAVWVRRSPSRGPTVADGRSRLAPGVFAGARAVLAVTPAVGASAETVAHVNGRASAAGVGLSPVVGRLPGALVQDPPPRPRPAR